MFLLPPSSSAVSTWGPSRLSATRVVLQVCGHLAATAGFTCLLVRLSEEPLVAATTRALLPLTVAAEAAVLLLSAAVHGALAAPERDAEDEVRAALRAGFSPFAQCLGRQLLSLVAPLLALLIMGVAWLGAQAVARPQPAEQGGFAAIVLAHVTLFCAMLMVGGVALLFALKRRPGRWGWRGALAGVLLTAGCLGALIAASGRIRAAEDPVPLINVLLLANPVVAAESALHRDVLRWSWVYDRVPAADYEFHYPAPLAACGVYMGVAGAALALSAWRLRRAYR